MKYNEKNIKRIVKAIANAPFHTFWNIHIEGRHDEIEHCEICFETIDGDKMRFVICGGEEMHAMYKDTWCGSIVFNLATTETLFMWIGIKLDEMFKKSFEI